MLNFLLTGFGYEMNTYVTFCASTYGFKDFYAPLLNRKINIKILLAFVKTILGLADF